MRNSQTLCLALEIAEQICAGTTDPYGGAVRIWTAVREAHDEDFDELKAFIGLASEWQDDPSHRELIASDIRDEALKLLDRFGHSSEDTDSGS